MIYGFFFILKNYDISIIYTLLDFLKLSLFFETLAQKLYYIRYYLVETNRMVPRLLIKKKFTFWCKGGPFYPKL